MSKRFTVSGIASARTAKRREVTLNSVAFWEEVYEKSCFDTGSRASRY